jgi:hypothetical protein
MATVGTGQQPCGNQEQGLLAAWMALDPNGENADQARSFLRPDAYLLIVVVTDEEDCSSVPIISTELYPHCACLADTAGCRADGACGITTLDLGGNKKDARVLYPTSTFVNKFKTLKADPAMIVFAGIVGDVLPGTPTSPKLSDGTLPAAEDVRERYYDCKCQQPPTPYSALSYSCSSAQGKADLGKRYIDVAAAFGNRWGQTSNICDDSGLSPALERIANLVIPLLTQVCLPRPLNYGNSCADDDPLTDDRCADQVGCQHLSIPVTGCATDADCDDRNDCTVDACVLPQGACAWGVLADCTVDLACLDDEFLEIYKYKANDPTNRTLLVPDSLAEQKDYKLFASPIVCPRFRVTDQDCNDPEGKCVGFENDCRSKCATNNLTGESCDAICVGAFEDCVGVCDCTANCPAAETDQGKLCREACATRPENSVLFTQALQSDDRVEIRYRAKGNYGQ